MKRHIPEALKRELAVKAGCDPRTIVKVLNGEPVNGMAGDRARAALKDFGLLKPEEPPRR